MILALHGKKGNFFYLYSITVCLKVKDGLDFLDMLSDFQITSLTQGYPCTRCVYVVQMLERPPFVTFMGTTCILIESEICKIKCYVLILYVQEVLSQLI